MFKRLPAARRVSSFKVISRGKFFFFPSENKPVRTIFEMNVASFSLGLNSVSHVLLGLFMAQ